MSPVVLEGWIQNQLVLEGWIRVPCFLMVGFGYSYSVQSEFVFGQTQSGSDTLESSTDP